MRRLAVSFFAVALVAACGSSSSNGGDVPTGAAGSGGSSAGAAGAAAATAGAAGVSGGSGGAGGNTNVPGGAGGATAAGTGGAAGGAANGGSAGATVAGAANGGAAGAATSTETEPNDGTTDTEFNALAMGETIAGVIGTAGDADVFRFDATPGKAYVVRLDVPSGSTLHGHATTFDTGRNGDAAGNDFVKITRGDAPGSFTLALVAMGQGGYFIAVRDERNVDDGATQGGPDLTYAISVSEHDVMEFVVGPVTFGSAIAHTLADAGAIDVFTMTADDSETYTFDFQASGDADGRLWAFSPMTGDWVARNDDRSDDDPNPLLDDVPFEPAGPTLVIVDNQDQHATTFGYALTAKQASE